MTEHYKSEEDRDTTPVGSGSCPECNCEYCIDGDEPNTLICHDCGNVFSAVTEVFNFDKFMDATLLAERRARTVEHNETPQRTYAKKYRRSAVEQIRIRGSK